MPYIYLIRHAEAAAIWGDDQDPPLSENGQRQARQLVPRLTRKEPAKIISSPMQRARQTAQPLAQSWHQEVIIEPRLGEIPVPEDMTETRQHWLKARLRASWSDQKQSLQQWRKELLSCIREYDQNIYCFTHFVAINTLVGAANNNDRLLQFTPAHTSVTEIQVQDNRFIVRHLGKQATISIL